MARDTDARAAPPQSARPPDLASLSPDELARLEPFALWRRADPTDVQREQTRAVLAHLLRGLAVQAPPEGDEGLADSTRRWTELAAAVDAGDPRAARLAAHWLNAGSHGGILHCGDGEDVQLSALALASWSDDVDVRLLASVDLILALLPRTGPRSPRGEQPGAHFTAWYEEALALQLDRLRELSDEARHLAWHMLSADLMLLALEADGDAQGYWAGHGSRARQLIDSALLRVADRIHSRREAAIQRRRAEQEERDAELLGSARRSLGTVGRTENRPKPEPPTARASTPGAVVPFPGFEGRRLTESRNALASHYAPLGHAMPVALVPPLAEVREKISALAREMPNARPVLDLVLRELALLTLGPARPLTLPPLLLVGPPGVGKTRLARRLAAALGLGFAWQSAAASSDTRELSGTARGWSSAHPAWPVEQLVRLGQANPLLLIDEIDKASGDRRDGSVFDAMLTYLERDTARQHMDPCLGGPVDLSHISWILTANEMTGLPAPLRSRVHVVTMEPPVPDALPVLLSAMQHDLAAELDLPDSRLLPELSAMVIDLLTEDFARHRAPRRIKRALRTLLALSALSTAEAPH